MKIILGLFKRITQRPTPAYHQADINRFKWICDNMDREIMSCKTRNQVEACYQDIPEIEKNYYNLVPLELLERTTNKLRLRCGERNYQLTYKNK